MLVAAILVLIFIAAQPSIALFSIGLSYVLSGPFTAIFRYQKLKAKKPESRNTDKHGTTP